MLVQEEIPDKEFRLDLKGWYTTSANLEMTVAQGCDFFACRERYCAKVNGSIASQFLASVASGSGLRGNNSCFTIVLDIVNNVEVVIFMKYL